MPLHLVRSFTVEQLIYSWTSCRAFWFAERDCVWDKASEVLFMTSVFECQMGESEGEQSCNE